MTTVTNRIASGSAPRAGTAIALATALALLTGCAGTALNFEDGATPPSATADDVKAPAVSELPPPDYHYTTEPVYCSTPGNDTLSSVVRVATHSGSEASGVVIADNRILTAAHVVKDEVDVMVYVHGIYQQATVIARDRENDLALLMANTGHLRPIRISQRHLLTAEPVWTVGYPLALELKTNFGRYQQHVNGAIHSSAGTNAGASGGGLLHCESGEYELAGMIRGYGAYWHAGELRRIEDLSISVPADTISSFAMSAGIGL